MVGYYFPLPYFENGDGRWYYIPIQLMDRLRTFEDNESAYVKIKNTKSCKAVQSYFRIADDRFDPTKHSMYFMGEPVSPEIVSHVDANNFTYASFSIYESAPSDIKNRVISFNKGKMDSLDEYLGMPTMKILPVEILNVIGEAGVSVLYGLVNVFPALKTRMEKPGMKESYIDKLSVMTEADGLKEWWFNGLLHRDGDLPAIEYADGTKIWYQHGKRHRDNDKPAVEHATGTKMWYQHGKRHRDNDKPAVEWANGNKEWHQHGELHRDNDKPAIEWANGNKEWYQHGELHRDNDKPAIEWANGNKEWHHRGPLHRDNDKPAIEWANGDKMWYQHGKLHRDNDKPAVELHDGTKEWYQRGERHRDNDKPAIEWADGGKEWYQHGESEGELIRQSL